MTEECEFTHADNKVELRMWEKNSNMVTGGNLDAIKSVKISGTPQSPLIVKTISPTTSGVTATSTTDSTQMLIFQLDNDHHQKFFDNPGAFRSG